MYKEYCRRNKPSNCGKLQTHKISNQTVGGTSEPQNPTHRQWLCFPPKRPSMQASRWRRGQRPMPTRVLRTIRGTHGKRECIWRLIYSVLEVGGLFIAAYPTRGFQPSHLMHFKTRFVGVFLDIHQIFFNLLFCSTYTFADGGKMWTF